jgi:hypothetical protein
MSTSASCFENIIGLSRTPCECVEDAPEGANVSNSGLYLDELPGLHLLMVNAGVKCGEGTLWDKLARARANAIEDTKAELGACLSLSTTTRRQNGIAHIGNDQKITADAHRLTKPYHGMILETAKVKGGSFVITAMATAFKAQVGLPATIEVSIYDRFDLVTTRTLNVVANRVTWTTIEPIALSMSELGTLNPRYWFTYEPIDGMKSMNSLINCGCGGYAPEWNESAPSYASSQQKAGSLWADWCMAAGVSGDDLEVRENWMRTNQTNGLILKAQFSCDASTSFCADQPDYVGDPVQKVIAHTVRFKAGANLITDLIADTRINQYTMTAGDDLRNRRSNYQSEWQKRINEYLCPFLSQPDQVNRYGDCAKCQEDFTMVRALKVN